MHLPALITAAVLSLQAVGVFAAGSPETSPVDSLGNSDDTDEPPVLRISNRNRRKLNKEIACVDKALQAAMPDKGLDDQQKYEKYFEDALDECNVPVMKEVQQKKGIQPCVIMHACWTPKPKEADA